MKRGLLWGICIFNMVAIGVTIFIVFRPYLRPKNPPPEFMVPSAQTTLGDWKTGMEQATDLHQVQTALAQIPNDEPSAMWLEDRIKFGLSDVRIQSDAFYLDRLLAVISRWGQFLAYGDSGTRHLQEIIEDKSQPILVRTVSLQTLAEAVFRHGKADSDSITKGDAPSPQWQDDWKMFLTGLVSMASGTGLQGQTLALMDASQQQGLCQWSQDEWSGMLPHLLQADSAADESSVIVALSIAPVRLPPDEVRPYVRRLVDNTRSEALKSAAINTLAQIANDSDKRWLATYSAESVRISQALWAARARLTLPQPAVQ